MLDQLATMTWKNPIFMLVFFGVIWYLPGLLLRRRQEYLYQKKKEAVKEERIKSLYPKENK